LYTPILIDRAAYNDAVHLIDHFGDNAGIEAADRADASRDKGNHIHFCHWRQIERLILVLSISQSLGTVH